MRKKEGFTLIELLAVIVILAIIALIAVPTIINIINKANKSAFKDTAYGIVNAGELYYAEKLLDTEGMTSNETFTFPNGMNGLQIKGKMPESGSMVVNSDGDVALAISNSRYCATKGFGDKDVTITENFETCEIPVKEIVLGMPVYFNPVSNQICENYVEANSEMGVKTGCMRWYVYKIDNNNVGLILDHNTTPLVAWYSDGDDTTWDETNELGPLTLNNQLKLDTEDQGWKVKASSITIEDIMNLLPWYQDLEDKSNWTEDYFTYAEAAANDVMAKVEANASEYANTLEMYKAMTNMLITDYSEIALPSYLYEDLYDHCDIDGNCTTYGYWTSSAVAGSSSRLLFACGFGSSPSSRCGSISAGCAQLYLSQNLPSNNSLI